MATNSTSASSIIVDTFARITGTKSPQTRALRLLFHKLPISPCFHLRIESDIASVLETLPTVIVRALNTK